MTLIHLFYAFFTAGLFAMGGGLAIIPFLNDMIARYGWFTKTELTTLIALAEVTPGALGVNMATYAGFLAYGYLGAIVATFSLVLPSIILVSILYPKWQKIKDKPIVQSIFNAVKAATTGLIFAIFLSLFLPLFKSDFVSFYNLKIIFIFAVGFSLLFVQKLPMFVYLLIMAMLGILIF